ncbi:uncharacterized protein LOC115093113 [Rhinatrema bivittatum]|uniref:uncharacterized protein LOC115093113 n=1 Tax=Rhinatrema bivittatum TaxID=194408 RepID=UPI001128D6EE|nr:uncharacterized protein LOC115093113 [Rhinatrema bivittatum]
MPSGTASNTPASTTATVEQPRRKLRSARSTALKEINIVERSNIEIMPSARQETVWRKKQTRVASSRGKCRRGRGSSRELTDQRATTSVESQMSDMMSAVSHTMETRAEEATELDPEQHTSKRATASYTSHQSPHGGPWLQASWSDYQRHISIKGYPCPPNVEPSPSGWMQGQPGHGSQPYPAPHLTWQNFDSANWHQSPWGSSAPGPFPGWNQLGHPWDYAACGGMSSQNYYHSPWWPWPAPVQGIFPTQEGGPAPRASSQINTSRLRSLEGDNTRGLSEAHTSAPAAATGGSDGPVAQSYKGARQETLNSDERATTSQADQSVQMGDSNVDLL